MDYKKLQLSPAAPIARITLAAPPQNVIDLEMMDELRAAFAALALRHDVAAILLTGSDRAFSAGVDIAAHTPELIRTMFEKFHGVILDMAKLSKVLVAAVRGNCLGGGAEVALMCDMVVTADDAKWGFPEIQLACYPPVACVALAAAVGQKRAADLVMSGRIISGAEAAQFGLANLAVPAAEVEARAEEMTARLARLSPAALTLCRKAFYCWDSIHFDKGLARAEKIYVDELMHTEDCAEGIRAWLEKRKPEWKGK